MEKNDDLFLLIVENPNVDDDMITNPLIKQESEEDTDTYLAVDNIFETAEKHGHRIDIKLETDCADDNKNIHVEEDESYKEEKVDMEYAGSEENTIFDDIKKNNKKPVHTTLQKQGKAKSFVQDLIKQYPELRKSNKLLIKTLGQVMLSTKPPEPPENYYYLNISDFVCTLCGVISESEPVATRHYQDYHGPRYLICYACGDDFRSKTNLYKHEKRCKAPDAKIVLKARAITIGSNTQGRPYLHLRKTAPLPVFKKTYECVSCNDVFETNYKLLSHRVKEHGERPYQCHICPASYTYHSGLMRHSKKHTNQQFICDHCGRSFKLKQVLVSHLDTHLPVPKYDCKECDRRFAHKRALQIHTDRVHRNLPPPFGCQICPRRFSRMYELKVHMRNEHDLTILTKSMLLRNYPSLMSSGAIKPAKIVYKEKKIQ